MIRYRLTTAVGPVTVVLDARRPDFRATIQYDGSSGAIEQIRRDVERSYGLYGHLIGPSTTPLDLSAAMAQKVLAPYQPELLEGAAVLDAPHQKLPEGSVW